MSPIDEPPFKERGSHAHLDPATKETVEASTLASRPSEAAATSGIKYSRSSPSSEATHRFMAARPGARLAAWVVDMLLAYGPVLTLVTLNIIKGMDLSGGHLMRRLGDRLIAEGFAELNAGVRPQVEGLVLLCQVAAFTLFEWIWQTTPGKALVGLRVIRTDGTRIGFIRAAGRSLTFWVSQTLGFLPGSWGALGSLLALLAPVVTMRRANGYAGLHEVTTGTRVVSLKRSSDTART